MEGETREGLKRKRTSREKGPRNGEKEMWERKRRGGGKREMGRKERGMVRNGVRRGRERVQEVGTLGLRNGEV